MNPYLNKILKAITFASLLARVIDMNLHLIIRA